MTITDVRARSIAVAVSLLAALMVLMAVPAHAQDDGAGDDGDESEQEVEAEPTLTVALDIHDEVPASRFSPLGRVSSLVHGGTRGGQAVTADEIDAEAAAEADRSLEELGAERTPDGLVVTLPETILFEFDSAELIGDSDEVVERVAELLEYYEGVAVEVRGHTDARGDADYNQRLSEDRAGAVVDALVDAGAPASQLTAVGFGATQPVAPNETPGGEDDPEGRQQNRRVEVVLAEG